jgi:NB-ARC domain/TIR domain/WD domain, G-beta repeat
VCFVLVRCCDDVGVGVEAFLGDAVGGARDLVFVSYCRDDAEWVQRVGVLLRPLLRGKRLRLWVDTDLRAGDAWRSEIMRGIERSGVALLLVSADFLASDFIMEDELPALRLHGVRLAPVLVGDCLWKYEPQLAEVQWLHDVGRDGALNLVEGQVGMRDRRLREICERLLAVAPTSPQPAAASSGVALERPAPDAAGVAEVPVGSARGELFGVPGLPPGYVVRDELSGLIDAVIAVEGSAVGVTGQVDAVGLHGQGGIGKSVLAAALARDEGIAARFPGGVYWVTVGERPDVLGIQLDLLARLGAAGPSPRTVIDAVTELEQVLEKRRVLLMVDDVWSLDAARAFRVTGPRGRVVYTSRDPRVLAGVGARAHRVDVLSPAAARAVAVGVLGGSVEELPPVVDQVFARVGRVALAVALLSAAVRGGRSWHQIAVELTHGVDVFGAHPYANAFAAMQVAVTELAPALREALLSLAVFPPDTEVPVSAIVRYWAHTRGHSRVETVVRREGESIGFHDLQHDYLLLHAPLLAHLHARLLDAYRGLLPPGQREQWWRLPVGEPYIWDQLVRHLSGAGEHAELCATVTDPAYLARRISVDGAHAAETDLAQAAAVLPTEPAIGWWQGWIARHAHLLTVPDRSEDAHRDMFTVSTMHAWLSADPTRRAHDINPERLNPLLPTPHLRVRWGLTPPPTALIRVLSGHTGGVVAVAWSSDGTRLASASSDGTVRVWDSASGTQLCSLSGHTGWVVAVAWSSDGTRLASASSDGTVRVWDSAAGTQLCSLSGHTGWVVAVAWSSDGTRLATVSGDGTVRVWDSASGTQLCSLSGHTGWVVAVAWSPDGTRLASASDEGVLIIRELAHDERQIWLRLDPLNDLSWTAAGIAVAGAHGVIVLDLS